MDVNLWLWPVVKNLVFISPLIAVWVAGIAIAIVRRQRHPKASLWAIIALAILIVLAVTNTIANILLPWTVRNWGWSSAEMGQIFDAKALVISLLQSGAWVMLLYSLFAARENPASPKVASPPFSNYPSASTGPNPFSQQ